MSRRTASRFALAPRPVMAVTGLLASTLIAACTSGRPRSNETVAPLIVAPAAPVTPKASRPSAEPESSAKPSPSPEATRSSMLDHQASNLAQQLANRVINMYVVTDAKHRHLTQAQGHEVTVSVTPAAVRGHDGETEQYSSYVTLAKYAGQKGLDLLNLPVVSVGLEADTMLPPSSRTDGYGLHFTTVSTDFVSRNGHWLVDSLGTANGYQWRKVGDFSQAPAPQTVATLPQLDAISHQANQFIEHAANGDFVGYAEPPYAS